MKCVAYLRVSGKSQTEADGPRRQEETIRGFCLAHKIELKAIFSETISGTVEGLSRPVFCEMLETIENFRRNGEEILGIIVERVDRFARALMVSEILLMECRKRSVKVYAADRGELIDLTEESGDPTRKLLRQITSALAEWEKNSTVLKLRKARQAIKSRTGKCEGAKRYGHTPKERELLATVRVLVQPETMAKDVARMLNRDGFRTRFGTEFTENAAWRLMKLAGVPCVRKNPTRNFGDKRMVGTVNISQQKGQ